MLEKNNHYFQLEAGRYLYPIPFGNLNNHKVYARKKISDVNDAENFEMTAFVFFISPDNYIFNNNQIDFTGHPEILEQYDGIRISELQNYNGRQIFFSSMGNITPGNLETEFNEHSNHIKEWELQKEKTGVVIDDDDPEMQVKLPKLPEGMFWAYENGTMIAKPLKYLDGEYNKNTAKLYHDALKYLQETMYPNLREEIALEHDKIVSASGGAYVSKVATIYDLQQSRRFKIGDVIEVLGEYVQGDGGNGLRIIAEYNDGTGIQLANGLWGNVVHSDIRELLQYCNRKIQFQSTEGNLQGICFVDENTHFLSWVTGVNLDDRAEEHRITLYANGIPRHTWKLEPGSHGQQIKVTDEGSYYKLYVENRRSELSGWEWNLRGKGYEIWHLPKESDTGTFIKHVNKFSEEDDLNYNGGFVGEKFGLAISKKIETTDIRHTVTCTIMSKDVWYDEEVIGNRYLSRFTVPSKYTTMSMQTCWVDEDRELVIIGFSEVSVNGYPRYVVLDFSGNVVHVQHISPPKGLYGTLTKYEIEGIVKFKGKYYYLIQYQESGMSRHQWELICCSDYTKDRYTNTYNSKRSDYVEDNIIADNTGRVLKRDKAHRREFETDAFKIKALTNGESSTAGENNVNIAFATGTGRSYTKFEPLSAEAPSLFFYGENDPTGFSFQVKDNRVGVGATDYPAMFTIDKTKMSFKKPFDTNPSFNTTGKGSYFRDNDAPNRVWNLYFPTTTDRHYMSIQHMNDTAPKFMFYGTEDPYNKGSFIIRARGNGIEMFKISEEGYQFSVPEILSTYETYAKLDTPRMALKMQQDGIWEEYITFMDELQPIEKEQRQLEQQRQEAYQQALMENQDISYEDWLSTQPMQMSIIAEPQPSKELMAFKEKWIG